MSGIFSKLGSLAGPAAVIAAGSMGAGSVATLILAGAWFRYELLWVIPLTLPLFVAAVDSSSRIGSVNRGQGMLSIVRQHIHPGVAWLLLAVNVPVHMLVGMSQLSVMTSAFLSLLGLEPQTVDGVREGIPGIEIVTSIVLAALVAWLVLSRGYQRMQTVMTGLMVAMFVCFLLIALRSFSELGDILQGFVPGVPDDLPAPGHNTVRISTATIIAMVGSTIAPGSLLTIPYLSSDATRGDPELGRNLRRFIVNLGIIFGAYSIFILVAGGFALYALTNHAEIETVGEAGQVLTLALPHSLGFLGPLLFTMGLFIAAMTTLVICVQLVIYLSLDMFRKPWSFTRDNPLFGRLVMAVTLLVGVLAPVWDFPAMLKVVLMMGANVFVVPLVIFTLIYLLNRRAVMGEHTAGAPRNLLLGVCLIMAVALAVNQFPNYLSMVLK
ncbi:NRAMP family divalent metal transporter [Elongatibacter sediminis]|uniref:Divalent metal cation transporter n=1 Tax=Elongatibacter sediminis TaxID=3119006 RepID=A0AAW9R8I1_9GAMM